jgi:TRAP-type C4-dicarboxylate transport system permease small subunit
MSIFWELIEWTSSKMKLIGAACLMGMTLLTCVDVVGRFFRHPVFGSVELVTVMATIAVAAAMPFTHKEQGHIGVEILVRLLSPKKQCITDIFTGVLSLILFAIVTWRMTTYAADIRESGEVSLNLQLPTYVFIYFIAFCCLVFTLIILQEIIANVVKLRRGL